MRSDSDGQRAARIVRDEGCDVVASHSAGPCVVLIVADPARPGRQTTLSVRRDGPRPWRVRLRNDARRFLCGLAV
jgi:hypothetical protein